MKKKFSFNIFLVSSVLIHLICTIILISREQPADLPKPEEKKQASNDDANQKDKPTKSDKSLDEIKEKIKKDLKEQKEKDKLEKLTEEFKKKEEFKEKKKQWDLLKDEEERKKEIAKNLQEFLKKKEEEKRKEEEKQNIKDALAEKLKEKSLEERIEVAEKKVETDPVKRIQEKAEKILKEENLKKELTAEEKKTIEELAKQLEKTNQPKENKSIEDIEKHIEETIKLTEVVAKKLEERKEENSTAIKAENETSNNEKSTSDKENLNQPQKNSAESKPNDQKNDENKSDKSTADDQKTNDKKPNEDKNTSIAKNDTPQDLKENQAENTNKRQADSSNNEQNQKKKSEQAKLDKEIQEVKDTKAELNGIIDDLNELKKLQENPEIALDSMAQDIQDAFDEKSSETSDSNTSETATEEGNSSESNDSQNSESEQAGESSAEGVSEESGGSGSKGSKATTKELATGKGTSGGKNNSGKSDSIYEEIIKQMMAELAGLGLENGEKGKKGLAGDDKKDPDAEEGKNGQRSSGYGKGNDEINKLIITNYQKAKRVSKEVEAELALMNKNDYKATLNLLDRNQEADKINVASKADYAPTTSSMYIWSANQNEVKQIESKSEGRPVVSHPDIKKGSLFAIPFMKNKPTIDGKPDEWELEKCWVRKDKMVAMAYRPDGIYFYLNIRDKSGKFESNSNDTMVSRMWEFDSIEFWIDMNNSKVEKTENSTCQQFFMWPSLPGVRKTPEIYEVIWNKKNMPKISNHDRKRKISDGSDGLVASRVHPDGKGYELEAFIPAAKLSNQDYFAGGLVMGFMYIINHGSSTDFEDSSIDNYKKGYTYSEKPSTWGNAQYLGTDASIFMGTSTGEQAKYNVVEASTEIHIIAHDQDANSNFDKKDKIKMSAKNTNGNDIEIFYCDETDFNNGVFLGNLPITVVDSEPNDGKLSAIAGEQIEIEYVEFIQSGGEYNQSVKIIVDVVPPFYNHQK